MVSSYMRVFTVNINPFSLSSLYTGSRKLPLSISALDSTTYLTKALLQILLKQIEISEGQIVALYFITKVV